MELIPRFGPGTSSLPMPWWDCYTALYALIGKMILYVSKKK